ncbi:organic colvent ABC transporter permease [Synechococcus sp. KORDI-52]|uniref:RNB domain-containing ribonuclease n=1 Tax=Synechococcus sp. KORDI-52 TaxID=585425 RepID=UPI0004E0A070|nr:RNB domain-containing ribonuclease [Synechococcus sp. KORDI-52]AII49457.1 organic colvent ABC transporter permease [Synechococcus sp. KORDI-52]
MKFSVADLLDQLSSEQPSQVDQLAKILKLSNKSDKASLDLAVSSLVKIGVVEQSNEGGLTRPTKSALIDARLRCSSKGFCFAIPEDGGEDIYIRDHQLNHAWHGDRVLVRVTREGGRRRSPEGGVQCILERATRSLLAQVEQQSEQLLAAPLDDRILAGIKLPPEDSQHLPGETAASVVEVRIDRYPVAQHAAAGHVVRSLPLNGGPAADRDLLLTKAGLQDRAAAPRSSGKTPTTRGRVDLTAQPSLLLKGWKQEDAPGLPAVHVEAKDGGCRLWVHVPSVGERIGLGSSLDACLRDRGEALCLGEVWQPLLTPALNKATTFSPGTEADAVTVRLDIAANGELIDWEFMLSSVRPVADVSADQLIALAERKPKARSIPTALKPIKDQLGQLETLRFCSTLLLEHERSSGAVQLDLCPPQLEALGDLRSADPSGLRHRWVDAFNPVDPHAFLQPLLRAADRAWTAHRIDLQLPGIITQTDEPDSNLLTDVAKTAIALDLPLELDDEGCPSACELSQVFQASNQRRVLEQQLSHALPPIQLVACPQMPSTAADSDAEEAVSSSANTSLTPWTCATQHYSHLVNQQLLVALLTDGKDRPTVRQKNRLKLGLKGAGADLTWPLFTATQDEKLNGLVSDRIVHRLNSRRRQVLELEKDLLSMIQARSAQPLIGQPVEGRISGVQSYGFFVEVGESRVEGLVHVSSLNDDWYEYRSRQNRLVGRKNRQTYQLGDAVQVRVINVDVLRNQIDLDVIGQGSGESTEPESSEPLPVALSER